tara:strand:- start:18 stop:287 length:270 start_codon:yes stop_codon:yes gene_type:complete
MSVPTVTDTKHEEAEFTLEDRVKTIEGQVIGLFEQHKNILEYFREMALAVQGVANDAAAEAASASAAGGEEEVFENVIDLSLLNSSSEE